jgi:hypothetical protein
MKITGLLLLLGVVTATVSAANSDYRDHTARALEAVGRLQSARTAPKNPSWNSVWGADTSRALSTIRSAKGLIEITGQAEIGDTLGRVAEVALAGTFLSAAGPLFLKSAVPLTKVYHFGAPVFLGDSRAALRALGVTRIRQRKCSLSIGRHRSSICRIRDGGGGNVFVADVKYDYRWDCGREVRHYRYCVEYIDGTARILYAELLTGSNECCGGMPDGDSVSTSRVEGRH